MLILRNAYYQNFTVCYNSREVQWCSGLQHFRLWSFNQMVAGSGLISAIALFNCLSTQVYKSELGTVR